MIITEFLDPIIIDSYTEEEEIEVNKDYVLKDAPFVLTHLIRKPFQAPKQWTGCLYGADNLISKVMESNTNVENKTNVRYLKINEPTAIKLSAANTIEVIIFSVDYVYETTFMLFIQDMFIKCFYTTQLGNFIDEFVRNALLKKTIASGIDVLYIDDTIFGPEESTDAIHPTEHQLSSLVYLVRPKEVIGIFGNEIPLYIREYCQQKDYFKPILI